MNVKEIFIGLRLDVAEIILMVCYHRDVPEACRVIYLDKKEVIS